MVHFNQLTGANTNGQLARRAEQKSFGKPILSIVEMWARLLSNLKATTATINQRFDERARIEKQTGSHTDEWCINIFRETYARIEHLSSELEMQLAITQNIGQDNTKATSAISTFVLTPWQMEERYRALIQMQSYLGSFFERASPG